MSKKKADETVICDYYTKNSDGLKREYGEVNTSELTNIKGLDLPAHKNLSKLFKK
jgi:hypothetical protein